MSCRHYRFTFLAVAAVVFGLTGIGCSSLPLKKESSLIQKSLPDVVVDELVSDTQVLSTNAFGLAQAWWVPVEFWKVSLGRINPQLAQQVDSLLGEYSILAVVQADVSALGGFVFYPRQSLEQRLQVEWQREQEAPIMLDLVKKPNPAVRNLLQQLSPMLSRSMGEMGRNLQFFVFADRNAQGNRIVDPYAAGTLLIRLIPSETQGQTELTLDLPLNALFEPRFCSNGKPARATWRFCPWDGHPL